jgi:hypothetical protein
MGVSSDGQLVAGVQGILDVKTGTWRSMPECEYWTSPEFIPGGTLLATEIADEAKMSAVVAIVDYGKAKILGRFTGRAPVVTRDGDVLFLRDSASRATPGASAQIPTGYVGIWRYHQGQVKELKRLSIGSDHLYEVTEVVALANTKFVYRAYDEHEYRYYDQDDKPLVPGNDGHYRSPGNDSYHMGTSKEQYDLRVSKDGRIAVLAERNWNELTYLVVVDLGLGTRQELPVFGSFPVLAGRYVVFSSDPSFVVANEGAREFRQIADWALYAYDLDTKSLCLIGNYAHPTVVQ